MDTGTGTVKPAGAALNENENIDAELDMKFTAVRNMLTASMAAAADIKPKTERGSTTLYGEYRVDNSNPFLKFEQLSQVTMHTFMPLAKIGLALVLGFKLESQDTDLLDVMEIWADQVRLASKVENIARLLARDGTCIVYLNMAKKAKAKAPEPLVPGITGLDILPMRYTTLLPEDVAAGDKPKTLLKGDVDKAVLMEQATKSFAGTQTQKNTEQVVYERDEFALFRIFNEGYFMTDIIGRETYGIYGTSMLLSVDRSIKNLMDLVEGYAGYMRRYGVGRLHLDVRQAELLRAQGKKGEAKALLDDIVQRQRNLSPNEDIVAYGVDVKPLATGNVSGIDVMKQSLEADIHVGLLQSPLGMGKSAGSTYAAGYMSEEDRYLILESLQSLFKETVQHEIIDRQLQLIDRQAGEVKVFVDELDLPYLDGFTLNSMYMSEAITLGEYRKESGFPEEKPVEDQLAPPAAPTAPAPPGGTSTGQPGGITAPGPPGVTGAGEEKKKSIEAGAGFATDEQRKAFFAQQNQGAPHAPGAPKFRQRRSPDSFTSRNQIYAKHKAAMDATQNNDEAHSAVFNQVMTEERQANQDIQHGLAMGDLTEKQATDLGWHQSNGGPIEPLPNDLYHVTTAKDAVLQSGLKTRDELSQAQGKGLGGGASDTISFTDNPELAQSLKTSLLEARSVASGDKTLTDLENAAKAGTDAKQPYWDKVKSYVDSSEGKGYLDTIRTGKETRSELFSKTPQEMNANSYDGGGFTPIGKGEEFKGVVRYNDFQRTLTKDQINERTFRVYKVLGAFREEAGGPVDPLFFASDVKGLAAINPDQIDVIHATPQEGAQGFRMGALGEWRTYTGEALKRVRLGAGAGAGMASAWWSDKQRAWYFANNPQLSEPTGDITGGTSGGPSYKPTETQAPGEKEKKQRAIKATQHNRYKLSYVGENEVHHYLSTADNELVNLNTEVEHNSPIDVVDNKNKIGYEVKTFSKDSKDLKVKITPDIKARKDTWIKETGYDLKTVVVVYDKRLKTSEGFMRDGYGGFRPSNMKKIW